MKNIMVHINPEHKFSFRFEKDSDILVRIQIDNALELGWDKKDIILLTNFTYEYRGVCSRVVSDENFCTFRPLSSKTVTIANALESTMLGDDLHWVHDFDAFQIAPFPNIGKEMDGFDAGFTDYGWSQKWCMGSYFYYPSARGLFSQIKGIIYAQKLEDERALVKIGREIPGVKRLNITYNFGMRHIKDNWEKADKPLKVVHFHPWYKDSRLPDTTLNMFMYGKNELGRPLMSERLISLFRNYGIT